jgi:ribose transport system substrate-binding protein
VKTRYSGTPEYDVNKQLASFEQELARKPAGILLHPMNPDPFIEPINRAAAMGIPVVTFAADSPNSKRVSFVTSDNDREGAYAADAIAAALGGKGEYAVLENPGQDNHDRRIAAFVNRMKTKHAGMKLAGRAASNQDPNKAYQATLSIAQANPNLGAIFMPEANSALGAAQAKIETKKNIRVMCCDVNAKILDMIKSGDVFGAINPNQGMQGFMGMMLLFLAKNAQLIDPMNDARRNGANPMAVPFLDNGLSVVTTSTGTSTSPAAARRVSTSRPVRSPRGGRGEHRWTRRHLCSSCAASASTSARRARSPACISRCGAERSMRCAAKTAPASPR